MGDQLNPCGNSGNSPQLVYPGAGELGYFYTNSLHLATVRAAGQGLILLNFCLSIGMGGPAFPSSERPQHRDAGKGSWESPESKEVAGPEGHRDMGQNCVDFVLGFLSLLK